MNLAPIIARIENVRTHIGNVPDSREAVVARLDELGAIAHDLRALNAAANPAGDAPVPAGEFDWFHTGQAPTSGGDR